MTTIFGFGLCGVVPVETWGRFCVLVSIVEADQSNKAKIKTSFTISIDIINQKVHYNKKKQKT